MRKNKIWLLVLVLIFLAGCRNEMGNPRPEDFLDNEQADIFVLNDIVYSRADHLEWVKEIEYTLGEQIGEITKQSNKSWNFKEGTANKLPVGTKIYETETEITIAIVNDKEIAYIKMLEG